MGWGWLLEGQGGGRISDQAAVRDFLFRIKIALANPDNFHFVSREKNLDALEDLGMFQNEAIAVIRELTVGSYWEGPLEDHRGGPNEWWVFGPVYDGVLLYVKVAIVNDRVLCLSFHRAERTQDYPHR